MEPKIAELEAFTVLAAARRFSTIGIQSAISAFWQEHFTSPRGSIVMGTYGINIAEGMRPSEVEYLIADPCAPETKAPSGLAVRTIPAFKWAIFEGVGALPDAMTDLNRYVSDWVSRQNEHKRAARYLIERYDPPSDYLMGTRDESYGFALWVPVL